MVKERPEELWKEGQNNAEVLFNFLPADYGKPKSKVHLQEASYHILFQVGRSLAITLTWSHSPCPAHGQEGHRRLLLDGTSSEMLSMLSLARAARLFTGY